MRENQLSYDDVLNYFGSDKIENRYMFIFDKMQEYIKVRGMEEDLFINPILLQQAVMDYFVDIYRMKEFHKIEKTDMMKILAYESYWILRRKPIQSKNGTFAEEVPVRLDDRHTYANEGFITTLIAHEFLFPEVDEPLSEDEEDTLLDFLRHLNYHLKYRSTDKQGLEMVFHAFKLGRKLR